VTRATFKWAQLHFAPVAHVSDASPVGDRSTSISPTPEVAPAGAGRRRFSGFSRFPVGRLGGRLGGGTSLKVTTMTAATAVERFPGPWRASTDEGRPLAGLDVESRVFRGLLG